MLRGVFGLERMVVVPSKDRWDIYRRRRLLIISWQHSWWLLHECAMADMEASLGFDDCVANPEVSTDVTRLAWLVNSTDVMEGHYLEFCDPGDIVKELEEGRKLYTQKTAVGCNSVMKMLS